jgi:GH25 family lysozyme M1 (1,4-beta-N-acetylmuramidase)
MKKSKIIAIILVIVLLFQYIATLSYAYENITEESKCDEVDLLNSEVDENNDNTLDADLINENELEKVQDNQEGLEKNQEDFSKEDLIEDSSENSIENENEENEEEKVIDEELKDEEIIFEEDSILSTDNTENEYNNLDKEEISEEKNVNNNSNNTINNENTIIETDNTNISDIQNSKLEKNYVETFETTELKGSMCIDEPKENSTYNVPEKNSITVSGWAVSTVGNTTLKLYINNVYINSDFSRTSRPDVDKLVSPSYGGTTTTPKAGFTTSIDISNLSAGKYTVKVEQISSNGTVISTIQKNFEIKDVSKTGSMCIDSVNNESRYNLSKVKNLTISGWAVSYTQNVTIDIYMNDVKIISNANRISRPDVDKLVSPSYGGTTATPKAGFSETIDISNYKSGAYTLRIEQVDYDGIVISKLERKFYIEKTATNQGQRGSICIDYPTGSPTYNINTDKSFQVIGWAVSTDKNSTVLAYVNNVPISTNIQRTSRADVDKLVSPSYGGTSVTPNAGFSFTIDISEYIMQNYTLTVEEISSGGAVLATASKNISIKKEAVKGSTCIDSPTNNQVYYVPSTSSMIVNGWAVANSSDVIVKAYINNVCVIENMERISRTDVDKIVSPSYGGTAKTPKAGFTGKIDISSLKAGTYTLKIEETTSNGTVISSSEKKITIKDDVLEGSMCIDVPSASQTYTLPNTNTLSIAGWAVSTDSNSTVRAYINNNLVIEKMTRSSRSDVDKIVSPSYGGTSKTPKAGFYGTIDISQYKKGTYTLKVEEVASNGKVICSQEKKFTIKYEDYKGTICIDYPINGQLQTSSSKTLLIQGWVLSGDSEDIIQIKVNGNSVSSSSISRYSRTDVEAISGPYGGKDKNSKAGFTCNLDTSSYAEGNYTITVNLLNRWGELLQTESRTIEVSKTKSFGVDVSHHNGSLDWKSLKNQGVTFAILRIGYGQNSNQLDSTFEYNYEQCKKYGIKVGIYLYSYAMSVEDSKKEAQNTLNWLKGRSIDLPVYYDIENEPTKENPTTVYDQSKLSKDTLTNMAITYMDIIQNAGYKAGLYTSKYWLESKFDMSKIENNYSVWVAHYTSMLTTTYKGKYDIWQYREGVKDTLGLEGCDWNYCYRKSFIE